MTVDLRAHSEALHSRVRNYVDEVLEGLEPSEDFDALACDLARHQAQCKTGLERLLAANGLSAEDLELASQIPAIPTDAFKLRRIACHEPAEDQIVFRTSGTTIGARGEHPMRTVATYKHVAFAWAQHMLFPDELPMHWVVLAPEPKDAPDSSLGFMMEQLGRSFGLSVCWLLRDGTLDLNLLQARADEAQRKQQPVILTGASFAFVHLLDALHGRTLPLPKGSRAMQTGGFKGKTREIEPVLLRQMIASSFALAQSHVVSEYGMTELSSQAYEGTLRAALGKKDQAGPVGLYMPPPWMRVRAVDPETLEPVEPGQVGLARIEDLANVDSAVVLQTADRVREQGQGFWLLGRDLTAPPRGCSIGIDELLGAP